MENQLVKPVLRGCQKTRHTGPVWVLCATVALSAGALAANDHERPSSAAPSILAKDEQALTQYRGLRRMHAKSDRFDDQEAWMEVWTELDEQGFRYEIVNERGADYVRNKVLKTVLIREQEIIAAGHADRAALTEENYVFTDDGMRDGFRHVLLKPKRKEVMLVEGRMVLSRDGSDLLRVEGRLAKNPSFWTSLVNVTRHFANVDGVRVPVSTESIAKIKFAGRSRMDVYYEYESINGRPVSTAARRTLAAALPGAAAPQ
jgi:hypothetical protein